MQPKCIKKTTITIIGILFLCSVAYARGPFDHIAALPSRTILGNIFGYVDDTVRLPSTIMVPGTDGLVALLFRIFNVAIFMFGTIFAGLIITQSVIQTAASGVFMGKKGSQMGYFTLFRTFSGLILVVPKASGYCFAQIFVMMVVTKSMTLAGNLSYEILNNSMLMPTDVLFSSLPALGATSSSAAINRSKLGNADVQNFYKKVISGSICAVDYNRRQPVPLRSSSQLYTVRGGKVSFRGCSDLTLAFSSLDSTASPTAYRNNMEANISLLISPIISSVFYNLPPTRPITSTNRNSCFTSGCSSGGAVMPGWLSRIVRSIESGHDAMAPNFVVSLSTAPSGGSLSGSATREYLFNWLDFPILYQAVMDVKGNGLNATGLIDASGTGLLDLAFNVNSAHSSSGGGTAYSDLSEFVSQTSLGNGDSTAYDTFISSLNFSNQGGSTASSHSIYTGGQLSHQTLFSPFSSQSIHVRNQIEAGYYSDRNILIIKIENLLNKLMFGIYPGGSFPTSTTYTQNATPTKLDHIWAHQGFSHFDEGAATFDRAYQRLQSRSGTERALQDPVDSLVFYTGDKWMETYLYRTSEIILSPARKLGEVAAFISGQTTFFMFTVMRNVMADQVMRSYNIFWTFFGTKIATGAVTALSSLLQEQMWDWAHCLTILPPQPIFGSSGPRHPVCNPMLLFLLVPVPNPAYGIEVTIPFSTIAVVTGVNIAAHVLDATLTGLFTYVFMLSSQYDYAYNGYIVMATMPVMVITNLLAVWIPVLPSLVYFISVIGWIFAVAEAMIAAPLVVMGMTFPQGHDLLGSSQQAMALTLSVFLRAPLIVVGFFLGMMTLSIAMYAFTQGIVPVALGIFNSSISTNPSLGDAFLMYAFMVVVLYVTGLLLMQAISLTYKLPNKILLWVGGQPTDGIEEETTQAIQGLVNQQQGSILQSIGQAAVAVKSAAEGVSQSGTSGFKAGKSVGK